MKTRYCFLLIQKCPVSREWSDGRNANSRRNRANSRELQFPGLGHLPSDNRPPRRQLVTAARAFLVALLLCLGSVNGWAQQDNAARGLDEQVQEVKSDILNISAELSRLEEKLLYPSGTQVAIFLELAKNDSLRLDAVRLQIDGQLVAHHIYSFKELEALRKGGVQRIYIGNVTTGDHKLEVLVDGKLEGGANFTRTEKFSFRKEVKPKQVALTVAGSGSNPITLGEW
jgi:hypothetical protein